RHGADGAARIAHRIDLVDGYGGQDALDALDLRLVHSVEELPGVRGKRFDIAPLAFRIERVEGKRTFAGAGYPGDHQQFAGIDVYVEVLEVVLAGAEDADL